MTPKEHEFALKELIYFKQQARLEVSELTKGDWRNKQLAQSNLEQANRMILHYTQKLKSHNQMKGK